MQLGKSKLLSVIAGLLLLFLGIAIGIGFMTMTTRDNQIDLPLVANLRSPHGDFTAYVFETRSEFATVSKVSEVYITTSNAKPRQSDLVFASERAPRPQISWQGDYSLAIHCAKRTRIMKFQNWYMSGQDDSLQHIIGIGITCGDKGWRDLEALGLSGN